jgi:prepilin-type N-terminal cleavage/methylation domain-containing protein
MVKFIAIPIFLLLLFALACDIFSIYEKTRINKKIRKEIKMKNKGFTLIELMITMFLMGFVLLAMGAHVGLVIKTTVKDKQITAGSTLLQDKMEGVKRAPYASLSDGTDTAVALGATYNRNWTVTPVSNNMKQVQVVISWTGGTVTGSTVISQ